MNRTPTNHKKKREIFFEFTRLESNLRVCAVDAVTGLEVVTVLPASMPENEAQNIALKKLLWRLGKDQLPDEEEPVTSGKYL